MKVGVSIAVVAALIALLECPVIAAEALDSAPLPPGLDSAIDSGLAYLVRQQTSAGSFESENAPKVALSGLSLLAFLSAGNAPDVGRYGLVVRNCVDWLVSQQASDGYFGNGERGLYTHAIVTLALAEDYGLETSAPARSRVHAALAKALDVIIAAQKAPKTSPDFVGGWRYERNSPDSDLSLSGWNSLALRALTDIGLAVPADSRQHAAEFVVKCFDDNQKGFAYQPHNAPQPGDTAIGMLCLYVLDAAQPNAQRLEDAAKYLQSHPIDDSFQFPCYAMYFQTQASFQHGGETWNTVGRGVIERLIQSQQKDDGGWPPSKGGQEPGRAYATALAVQTLAIPYHLLPVYQR